MPYVYVHKIVKTGIVFYVGIGSDDEKFARSYSTHSRNRWWKFIIAKHRCVSEILYKNLDWQMACSIEQTLIAKYRRRGNGGTLVNMTDGGEGSINAEVSQETRNKLRLKMLGNSRSRNQKWTKERREAARIRMLGNTFLKGKKRTWEAPDNRKKVINTKTGKIFSSVKLAAKSIKCQPNYLSRKLTGKQVNNTPLKYYTK